MNQPSLFPRARRVDDESSHAAADQVEASGAASRQHRVALECVAAHPGRTSRELSETPTARRRIDLPALYRRLPELETLGRVYRVKRGPKPSLWYVARTGGNSDA